METLCVYVLCVNIKPEAFYFLLLLDFVKDGDWLELSQVNTI